MTTLFLILALLGWAFAILAGLGYRQMRKEYNDALKMVSRINAECERLHQQNIDLARQKSLEDK